MLSSGTFETDYPKTHLQLFEQDLAYYKVQNLSDSKNILNPTDLSKKAIIDLVKKNELILIPITCEDFLSSSAAGIFKSNLSIGIEENNVMQSDSSVNNKAILEKAMGRKIISQHDLYGALQVK
jgi:uncharacterized glyoxalase superfamily metalloenzyme YdcJ